MKVLTFTTLLIVGALAWSDRYDYIVVGAGTAGSVVAARLSENPEKRVLLVEQGKDVRSDPLTTVNNANDVISTFTSDLGLNVITPLNVLPTQGYPSKEGGIIAGAANTVVPFALGGGPSVSGSFFGWGDRANYDEWAQLVGDSALNFTSLLPFFQKVENVSEIDSNSTLRGRSGPVNVLFTIGNDTNLDQYAFAQAQTFNLTIGNDYCNSVGLKGIWNMQRSLRRDSACTATTGPCVRQDTYSTYIKGGRPNLEVITSATVVKINTKITIWGPKAVGIDYYLDGELITAKARKEVIISAGAIGSPKLLLLSGIGPAADITSVGIPSVKNLAGVGHNFHDQVFTTMVYANPFGASITSQSSIRETFYASGLNGDNVDIEMGWGLLPPSFVNQAIPGHLILSNVIQLRNTGTGYVKLRSKNPFERPDISHGLNMTLFGPLVRAMKDFRAWMANYTLSTGLPVIELYPGTALPNPATDQQYLIYLTSDTSSSLKGSSLFYHPAGSVKMGRDDDPMAVVNSRYQVRGVAQLRVVDCSVQPIGVATHPSATAMALGEQAAEYIIQDNS